MASTPEGLVKGKITKILKSYGSDVSYFMPVAGMMGKSGVSDFVCCIYGQFVAIEVKADKKKNPPTALQELYLEGVRKAGGWAMVIDAHNVGELKAMIDTLLKDLKGE